MIKKILLLASLLMIPFAGNADSLIGGGVQTNAVYLLSTNGGYVYSITISAPNTATVLFYDQDLTNAPHYGTNYSNAAQVYRATTNGTYVTSYVGANGLTNWFTNIGVYSYIATNAATTSQLPVMGAFIVAGGQSQVFNTDMLFREGISVYISTNATVVVNRRQN